MKIIVIDSSIFMFKSIFSWYRNRQVPYTYLYLRGIISCLKKIGVDPGDKIVLGLDDKKSWRKEILPTYKANRKIFREKFDIDWNKVFNDFETFILQLSQCLDWYIIRVPNLEFDDIAGIIARRMSEKNIPVIIISSDSDLEQLAYYKNVKIFSDRTKRYKIIKNPLSVLKKKVEQGDASDNILVKAGEEEFLKRVKVIDLINLSEDVQNQVVSALKNYKPSKLKVNKIPFKSLRDEYLKIFDKDKVITYEECLEKQKKKRKRRKKNAKKN